MTKRTHTERRDRQAREIAVNHELMRKSIAETDRLVDEADKMLKRHRAEEDEAS